MWALSPRGLSFAQSVIGEDKPHFKGLGDQMQIRTLATVEKRLRRLGGFWSQGLWPGWSALWSHFVRSVRMKWKLAAVYFMMCVLYKESLCTIIFDCLLTWLPSPRLGRGISCTEMTRWQMQNIPCVISHSGMLKRKYFLQEHTSKITMKVIGKKVVQYTNIFCTTSLEWSLHRELSSPVVRTAFSFLAGSLLIKQVFCSSKVLSVEQTFTIELH